MVQCTTDADVAWHIQPNRSATDANLPDSAAVARLPEVDENIAHVGLRLEIDRQVHEVERRCEAKRVQGLRTCVKGGVVQGSYSIGGMGSCQV